MVSDTLVSIDTIKHILEGTTMNKTLYLSLGLIAGMYCETTLMGMSDKSAYRRAVVKRDRPVAAASSNADAEGDDAEKCSLVRATSGAKQASPACKSVIVNRIKLAYCNKK